MTTMLQSRHATRGKLVSRLQAEFGACRRERDYFLETARALTSVRDHKAVLRIILDKAKTMVRCEAWSNIPFIKNSTVFYARSIRPFRSRVRRLMQ